MPDILDEIADSIPALRRYARALLRDRDAADDLVQDCLERAIRKRGLWQPTGSLRAWLFRIMLNLHRSDLRRGRGRAEAADIDTVGLNAAVPPEQPARLALAETARAIERLPAEQREVLLLVALEGFGYAETAKILGIPLGTMMSRLARARATLRNEMQERERPRLRTVK